MTRSLAQPRSRRGIVIFILVLLGAASVAAAGYVLHLEHEAPVPELVDASVGDAAVDARAAAKPKPGKKPAPRGGKTRVAGHAPAAAHPPTTPHVEKKTPAQPPVASPRERAPSGPTYEAALDSNDEQVAIGAKGPAELTDAQLSAPMNDGTFLSDCDVPETTSVTVKVAIRGGHAVGVSVETNPPSGRVGGCIDRHVRTLSWPSSPKMDSLVTTY